MGFTITYTETPAPSKEEMGLTVTHPRTHATTRNVPAKMLIVNAKGKLIPCNYQYWYCASDYGVGSGNDYVPSGEGPVSPENLTVVQEQTYESETWRSMELDEFIRNQPDAQSSKGRAVHQVRKRNGGPTTKTRLLACARSTHR